MSPRGKTYKNVVSKIDAMKRYSVEEAFKMVKETKRTKFDEMVDVAVRLGVDPKQSDQAIRGAVAMPHGIGKKVRVIVFAKGEKQTEAQSAGADFVGDEDLINKIEKENWLGFDTVISTPDMMKSVSRVAKILGPRGLMPNPKIGTVTFDVGNAVKQVKAGKIEFRAEKAGIVHASIGKVSFASENLRENFMTLMEALMKAKPASAKGNYLKTIALSTTMGPSIKIDTNDITRTMK
jgi:large subunit ribosomal protein L1